jgi:branched-chain amino acid aminotransferase
MTTLWVNGRFVDEAAPSVSALDHGLTVGDGVFETLKVVDGRPFALTRHLDRLVRSAKGMGLSPPTLDHVRRACEEVVNTLDRSAVHRLRITYTAGPGPLGSDRSGAPPTLLLAASAAPAWAAGARVAVAPWPRNERGVLTGLKTTSYGENVVALSWAAERGADEAVLLNTRGELCEGTGSNVFVVHGASVRTPRLESGCLAGITRALVLEWTDAVEGTLTPDDLHNADEAFLTSSTRDVQPIVAVDGRDLPIGGHTRRIAEVFADYAARDLDP